MIVTRPVKLRSGTREYPGRSYGAEERPAWVARNAEARDLMTFSVSDAYAEARSRLGL